MEHKILNLVGIIAVIASIGMAFYMYKGHKMNIGIRTENMDTSVVAGDNFYDYATLGWRRANPLPDDYTRYGTFEALYDTNLMRVREIAESDNGKIGTLYRVAMNAEKLNADKTVPVMPYLHAIDEIKSKSELASFLGKMHAYSSAFWGDGVALDEMDSTHYLYNIGQGGIGLARDYYFDQDAKTVEIRKKYLEYISNQMKNFGIDTDAKKLYAFEERMAKSFFPKEKLRDPHANYHKMTRDELIAQFPNFDWNAYFTARGINPEYINVNQPSAISESIAIMNDTDLDMIKTYLKYRIVNGAAGLLDDKTYDIAFDFYNRTMSGQIEPKPRWKRAISILDDSLGEEIGALYVKKYFPPRAKARMEKLVKNLQSALGMRIQNLEWMSPETKASAMEKLNSFHAKIGYPEKWRDTSKLEISPDSSLWENMVGVARFNDRWWLDKIGQEKDPTIWYMNAHEINAYYDPSTNEICFPAGILQYPFFDMDADDAFNYGAIGSIIGHEMTHGFDDSGRKFDATGNLRDWWTDQDASRFDERANVLKEYFNNIEIADGVHANGEFTLGENLADYGGITVSLTAYQNFGEKSAPSGNLTDIMRFFIAYAGTWAQNMRPEAELVQTKTNEHSLNKNRVNGILPHIDAWYDAFNVTDKNKMYISVEKRIKLW